MVNQQLAVVHAFEHLDVRLGTKREQVFRLRLGGKGLLRSIPEMNVFARNML